MLVLVTKASSDYWYQIRMVETIDDLLRIDKEQDGLILTRYNHYKDWTDKEFLNFWNGIKKEDIPLIRKADCHVTIYDDYIE